MYQSIKFQSRQKLSFLVLGSFLCAGALLLHFEEAAFVEKAPYSKEKLQSVATDIVVGKVQKIYTTTEQKGKYHYTRYLAEVAVDSWEKGKGPSDLVYLRYFDIHWKGSGPMPPGPSGHSPLAYVGKKTRFYLARNAYDGFSTDAPTNQDGGYNVIYINGVEQIDR